MGKDLGEVQRASMGEVDVVEGEQEGLELLLVMFGLGHLCDSVFCSAKLFQFLSEQAFLPDLGEV